MTAIPNYVPDQFSPQSRAPRLPQPTDAIPGPRYGTQTRSTGVARSVRASPNTVNATPADGSPAQPFNWAQAQNTVNQAQQAENQYKIKAANNWYDRQQPVPGPAIPSQRSIPQDSGIVFPMVRADANGVMRDTYDLPGGGSYLAQDWDRGIRTPTAGYRGSPPIPSAPTTTGAPMASLPSQPTSSGPSPSGAPLGAIPGPNAFQPYTGDDSSFHLQPGSVQGVGSGHLPGSDKWRGEALDALGKQYGIERGRVVINGEDMGPRSDADYQGLIRSVATSRPDYIRNLEADPNYQAVHQGVVDAKGAANAGIPLPDWMKEQEAQNAPPDPYAGLTPAQKITAQQKQQQIDQGATRLTMQQQKDRDKQLSDTFGGVGKFALNLFKTLSAPFTKPTKAPADPNVRRDALEKNWFTLSQRVENQLRQEASKMYGAEKDDAIKAIPGKLDELRKHWTGSFPDVYPQPATQPATTQPSTQPATQPAPAATQPGAATQPSGTKTLTPDKAAEFLKQTGGDREQARKLARDAGWSF